MSYLKALGVFRIIAEQQDHSARAAWENDRLILRSRLDDVELVVFLLDEYTPTPVVAPWAGGCGFFAIDNKDALECIQGSATSRLAPFRTVIAAVKTILESEGQTHKPSEREKEALVRRYRRELPDDYLDWMDSVMVLLREGQSFPPILGTGGNDGRLDFTQNFMQRLVDVGICQQAGAEAPRRVQSEGWLREALFAEPTSGLLSASVGQFHPGRIGGPNASQGMEGKSVVNPWDFILTIEGAVMMSGAVARRLDAYGMTSGSFPFTVMPAAVGQYSLTQAEDTTARRETWLPVWDQFVGLRELKSVFSEGRAEVGGRQSRDGVEFARAVASLGVDRGFSGFVRYAFVKRSGKAFLATPLGRIAVDEKPHVDLLSELHQDGWRASLRRVCRSQKPAPPPRFPAALRRLEAADFDYCRYGGKSRFAEVLTALGRIERELSILPGEKVAGQVLQPAPILSDQWLFAANDGTPEFRIAMALASISGASRINKDTGRSEQIIGPLRENLESVARRGSKYVWSEPTGSAVWASGNLTRNLVAVLARRMIEASGENLDAVPIDARYTVDSADIALFLEGLTNDQRIAELLWGAVLIRPNDAYRSIEGTRAVNERGVHPLSRFYALLKLLFLPRPQVLCSITDGSPLRAEPAILNLLEAGFLTRALDAAARRLRSAGFVPIPGPTSGGRRRRIHDSGGVDPLRLCAALLIPVRDPVELKRMILREKEPLGL
jgi:CRISPR-associated protein Csx17